MDTNDFLGSFAQENVSFVTKVIKSTTVGDNYWKVMVFVENSRFVDSTDSVWTTIPGSTTIKALSVSVSDYADYTQGLLKSWLYDLFANGFTGDCILVACAADVSTAEGSAATAVAFITGMTTAYNTLKAYAYHKTVCAGSADAVDPTIAVALATLCADDKNLLSSAPYYPFTTATPETPNTDPLYAALTAAKVDAFMSCQADTTRNGALYALGLAMGAGTNGSGTVVGNSMDMVQSTLITASGASGVGLSKSIRTSLKAINVQTWKPVGNNSGAVAAIGAETLLGDTVQANWIIAYVTYMTKVDVADLITQVNFLRSDAGYSQILTIMNTYLGKFGSNGGSGRLKGLVTTAPAFANLPSSADDEIIIPNAWSATYVDQVRTVSITGALYIG